MSAMDTITPDMAFAVDAPRSPASPIEALFRRMTSADRDSFTERQRRALEQAAAETRWRYHPVNLRFSWPMIFQRYYCVIVAGPERRSKERRIAERENHPVGTIGNVLFLAALAAGGTIVGALIFTQLFIWFLADKL